ncbi:MAG: hypothetical protein AB4368_19695 [Xenococcaceae cyanobacterium]
MDKTQLLELIQGLISKGTKPITIILFAAFALCLHYLQQIISFFQFDRRRSSQLQQVSDQGKNISDIRRRNIQDRLWHLQYKILDRTVKTITNNSYLQVAIDKIHESAYGRIKYLDFQIALPLLTTDSDGILALKREKKEGYLVIFLNSISAIGYLGATCASLYISYLAFPGNNLAQKDGIALLIGLLIVTTVGFGLSVVSLHNAIFMIPIAKKIKKEIKRYKKKFRRAISE